MNRKNTPHRLTKGEKAAVHLICVLANEATLISVEMCALSCSQPDKLLGTQRCLLSLLRLQPSDYMLREKQGVNECAFR